MAKVGPLDPAVVATGLTLRALITILHIKLAKNHFKKLKPCQALKKKKEKIFLFFMGFKLFRVFLYPCCY